MTFAGVPTNECQFQETQTPASEVVQHDRDGKSAQPVQEPQPAVDEVHSDGRTVEHRRIFVLDDLLHLEDGSTVVREGGDVGTVPDEVQLGLDIARFDQKGGDEDDDNPVGTTTEENSFGREVRRKVSGQAMVDVNTSCTKGVEQTSDLR